MRWIFGILACTRTPTKRGKRRSAPIYSLLPARRKERIGVSGGDVRRRERRGRRGEEGRGDKGEEEGGRGSRE